LFYFNEKFDFVSRVCRSYLSEIFFLFASLIAAWFLCWHRTRIYFLLGSLLPPPIFWSQFHFTAAPIFPSCSLSRRAGPQVFHSVLHLDAWGWVKVAYFFLLFKLEHAVQGPHQICLPAVAVFTYPLLLV
jgi:hypothetical protein